MKNIPPFLFHVQTILKVNQIYVQYYSLGSYQNDFVSKRPISEVPDLTFCLKYDCIRKWSKCLEGSFEKNKENPILYFISYAAFNATLLFLVQF